MTKDEAIYQLNDLKENLKDFRFLERDIEAVELASAALLNQQEGVKPEKACSDIIGAWWNMCGACKTVIHPDDRYCRVCGTKVLWEGENDD